MKGDTKILQMLNDRLAEELTAISTYMVHSEMCSNWGYDKLHEAFEKQAIDEMKHAEALIGRILFLDGTPLVSKLNKMKIGSTVEQMLAFDREDEADAIKAYNESIAIAVQAGDNGTRELLHKILLDEERHVDWAESQRDLAAQMGMQIYLTTKV
jgi:bacterioferritin